MTAVLLTHESPFQIYCANRLFRAGVLKVVLVEDGLSIRRERLNLRERLSTVRAGLLNISTDSVRGWRRASWQLRNVMNHRLYYGQRNVHHQRLLRDYQVFDPQLAVIRVGDINSAQTVTFLRQQAPTLVFVHGTRLIRRSVLEAVRVPFVNLHWGWSPHYRGEGIVSALALEGPHALGVTVHLLDEGIDSGPILYQARPSIDALDNFYSIAVKLTMLGTELFLKVAEEYARHGSLSGTPHTTDRSPLFSGKYLRDHPELFPSAWRNLERAKRVLSASVDSSVKSLTTQLSSCDVVTAKATRVSGGMIAKTLLRRSWRMVNRRVIASSAVARRLLRDATVVFLYHEVSNQPSAFNRLLDLNVPPAIFCRQLDLISETFHFIDPQQLLHGDYPRPAALLTFDDGNQGYVRHVLPILKAKQIPSVGFLNMGPIQGEVCWSGLLAYLRYGDSDSRQTNGRCEQRLSQVTDAQVEQMLACRERDTLFERVRVFRGPLMTHADLQALAQEPLVFLGSHLYNHYNAALLPPERLRQEFWKNQRLLDAHPRGTRLLSYPFGQPESCYTHETIRLLRQEGVAVFFSAYPLPNVTSRNAVFHRVPMSASVQTTEDLYEAILRNYLRARLRVAPVRLS